MLLYSVVFSTIISSDVSQTSSNGLSGVCKPRKVLQPKKSLRLFDNTIREKGRNILRVIYELMAYVLAWKCFFLLLSVPTDLRAIADGHVCWSPPSGPCQGGRWGWSLIVLHSRPCVQYGGKGAPFSSWYVGVWCASSVWTDSCFIYRCIILFGL